MGAQTTFGVFWYGASPGAACRLRSVAGSWSACGAASVPGCVLACGILCLGAARRVGFHHSLPPVRTNRMRRPYSFHSPHSDTRCGYSLWQRPSLW